MRLSSRRPLRPPVGRGRSTGAGRGSTLIRWLPALVLTCASLGVIGEAASAQFALPTPARPERCAMGFYLSDLYDLDTKKRTFGADAYT